MYPENPEGTRVILGYMNMGYDIFPTLPGLGIHNLFHLKRVQIPLGHSGGHSNRHVGWYSHSYPISLVGNGYAQVLPLDV